MWHLFLETETVGGSLSNENGDKRIFNTQADALYHAMQVMKHACEFVVVMSGEIYVIPVSKIVWMKAEEVKL